jgi:ParB family chromosome partitioning protein
VSKRQDGDWDIISGNNRVDIYRELGRTEIAVFEVEATKEEGDISAFYANLLHQVFQIMRNILALSGAWKLAD